MLQFCAFNVDQQIPFLRENAETELYFYEGGLTAPYSSAQWVGRLRRQ